MLFIHLIYVFFPMRDMLKCCDVTTPVLSLAKPAAVIYCLQRVDPKAALTTAWKTPLCLRPEIIESENGTNLAQACNKRESTHTHTHTHTHY